MSTIQYNYWLSTGDIPKKFIVRLSQYIQVVAVVNTVLKITLSNADMIYQDSTHSSGILHGVSVGLFLNSGRSLAGKPTREHFLGFLISAFLRRARNPQPDSVVPPKFAFLFIL